MSNTTVDLRNGRGKLLLFLIYGFIFILQFQVFAWHRPHIQDGMLVESSELIVIGHLQKDSIVYVPHDRTDAKSWEHHAALIVTKVLKGKTDKTEIPIIVHYGLDLKVDGKFLAQGRGMTLPGNPKEAIEIWDTGNSTMVLAPTVKDAGRDHIWFLRRLSEMGRKPGNGKLGIVNPEDIQAADLKSYFRAYLAENPEQAVRKYTEGNPELADRAGGYLDHLKVLRIIEIEDPDERLHQLMPIYLSGASWNHKSEARDGIIACGQIAGPALMDVYERSPRNDILRLLGLIRYRGCVPLLIEVLEKNDQLWGA